eukprot:gene13696-16744_t
MILPCFLRLGDQLWMFELKLDVGEIVVKTCAGETLNVLEDEAWDTQWRNAEAYLEWCAAWSAECLRVLRPDGLCFIFGQLGKREHTFIHLMSRLCQTYQFHDLLIWDRAVGYNGRRD